MDIAIKLLNAIENRCKVVCGYAALKHVATGELEDRLLITTSFVLSAIWLLLCISEYCFDITLPQLYSYMSLMQPLQGLRVMKIRFWHPYHVLSRILTPSQLTYLINIPADRCSICSYRLAVQNCTPQFNGELNFQDGLVCTGRNFQVFLSDLR